MITVTDLAAEKLKEILQEEGQPEACLRVMISPGANGGASYMLSLEEQAKEDDSLVDANGVKLVVDSDSVPLLDGTEIDYVEGLMRSGFVINNPSFASEGGDCCGGGGGSCACGAH